MPKRILIDATHAEETRVVVLENGRVQEFDSETSIKKQLKGNIYLAKVTRVEPSLQAAFVEYGGDRHGFLPFSEIHPDYYNIPVADKEELLRTMRETVRDEEVDEAGNDAVESQGDSTKDDASDSDDGENARGDRDNEEAQAISKGESFDNDDVSNPLRKNPNLYRRYKIQEVIKRNQIILVQVEKEERGNKGASLTTFVSLAGRYCVLMPNALRKGGVSRKIGNAEDRRRLKTVIGGLNIPEETGIIVRTAGAGKTSEEIRSDYDYLANLWNDIRNLTLSSDAPAFIHAEGDVVKRTIRDLYSEEVDEILIESKDAYHTAREFMRIITPEHVAKVKQYKNKIPIFSRYRVEEQIAALYSHEAPLESGGSIVISPTEALISIDVNSGRSTSQRNVEETALSTNLEAARELARQLRLRDLSGLIVVDFIDMMELKNRKAVERALKEAFAEDRAKTQIGRISTFGLLEMSRQRLRPSFLEVNATICPHCRGAGRVKATESTSVTVLRAIENEISRDPSYETLEVSVPSSVAMYILNHKRRQLGVLEETYGVRITLSQDEALAPDMFSIDRGQRSSERAVSKNERPAEPANNDSDDVIADGAGGAEETAVEAPVADGGSVRPERDNRRGGRDRGDRRRGGRGRDRDRRGGDRPERDGARRNDKNKPEDRTGELEPAMEQRSSTRGVSNVLEGLWKKIVD